MNSPVCFFSGIANVSIMVGLALILGACGEDADKAGPVSEPVTNPWEVVPRDTALAKGRDIWMTTCRACHATGLAGAPVAGNKAAWKARVAKGKPTLYKHAINGFDSDVGNTMPARGGNNTLSDDEVRSAVDYMISLYSE